ncbi:KTSC domain-containing protein [Xanthomonas translucens]|uniref:KTSC domain-containing protein n=1 Tax=Xanthomonas campestris pv. translucens TaxID=343 RepID=UPI00071E7B4F|nr:KTSC domain-containing protein [Xanthomonas translucens]QEN93607.1 KTSC domain-containing protein [Xanthomonas translucens pv. undulosa]QSQ58079.1 KTSC domain-containing protein [Xanthomonas translucens pv. undulosa]
MSETTAPRIRLDDVDSSQIYSIGHCPETNTLAIRFAKGYGAKRGPGALYHYANFTAKDFAAFKAADSLSKHFAIYIKQFPTTYPYHKVAEEQQAA